MSVWQDADTIFNFVYKTMNVEIFKRRKEWFTKMPEMHMALWYVPEGHEPTVKEAEERLNHIRLHGATSFAFTFKKRFLSDGTEVIFALYFFNTSNGFNSISRSIGALIGH